MLKAIRSKPPYEQCFVNGFEGLSRAGVSVNAHIVRCVVLCGFIGAFLGSLFSPVYAEHEIDHRFVIEGYVCKGGGQPAGEVEVVARDTRVSVGKAVYTDGNGYYRIQLHLHNDNAGDPILVSALDQEQRIKAQFDPKDLHSERRTVVTFGSGCDRSEHSDNAWVYYGVGIGLATVAVVAGARFMTKKQRAASRGKKQRKDSGRA